MLAGFVQKTSRAPTNQEGQVSRILNQAHAFGVKGSARARFSTNYTYHPFTNPSCGANL